MQMLLLSALPLVDHNRPFRLAGIIQALLLKAVGISRVYFAKVDMRKDILYILVTTLLILLLVTTKA